jgi:hypothetical protein
MAGRAEDAAGALRDGLVLFERKGNLVRIGTTKTLIAEVAAPH